eukprot:982149-Alexandrium_andersonii.AAC.1
MVDGQSATISSVTSSMTPPSSQSRQCRASGPKSPSTSGQKARRQARKFCCDVPRLENCLPVAYQLQPV